MNGKHAFLEALLCGCMRLYAQIVYGLRVHSEAGRLPAPCVILANHGGDCDHLFICAALFPHSFSAMMSSREFETPVLRDLFKLFAFVPKHPGTHDVVSIRHALARVREKRRLLIFPVGFHTYDGRPASPVQPGTGKLLKLLNVPVYTALCLGSTCTVTRFYKHNLGGKVDVTLRLLFSEDALAAASPNDIERAADAALAFNDWDVQQQRRVRLRRHRRAEGLPKVLYRCPYCGAEGSMEAQDNTLRCSACGVTAERDRFGFFVWASDPRLQGLQMPARLDTWMDVQSAAVRAELDRPSFRLEAEVRAYYRPETAAEPEDRGWGALTLSQEELRFQNEGSDYRFPTERFRYITVDEFQTLILFQSDGEYRFRFKDASCIMKWYLLNEILHGERR